MEGSVRAPPPVLEDEGKAGKDPNLAETRAQSLPSHFTEGEKCVSQLEMISLQESYDWAPGTVGPERLPSLNSGSFRDLDLFSTETELLLERGHPRHLTWEELFKCFPQHKYLSRS